VRIRRTLVFLVSGALLMAACGGGGDSPFLGGGPATSGPSAASERFVEAGNALADRWSERDAFFVVMWALDLGYSPDQIIEAAATGALDADGTISDPSGGTVVPERPPAGLLAIDGPSALTMMFAAALNEMAADTDQSPRDAYVEAMDSWLGEAFEAGEHRLEELRKASEIETNLAAQALELSARGYSQRQILEALLQFDVHAPAAYQAQFHAGLGPMCPYIEHDGVPVVPELDPSFLYGLECPNLPRPETSDTTSTSITTPPPAATGEEEIERSYSFSARLTLDLEPFEWTGAFSTIDGELVGSGAVTGSVDQTCGIEGGDEYPVAYTASGSFDITGTAGESTMLVVLVPFGGNVNVMTGDTSQLCVELSIDVGQNMVDFPLGNVESGSLPIEVPIDGGQASLDFGEGFVIEVTVTAR